MTDDIKLSIGVIVGTVVLLLGIVGVAQLLDHPDNVDVTQTTGAMRDVEGNPDASNTIVEFSDFQCPACAAAAPLMRSFMEKYGDQVKLEYRHFPLPQHTNSNFASYAAEAAGNQGKFWEAFDWLFANQSVWEEADVNAEYYYEKFNAAFELDHDQFVADFASTDVQQRVADDKSAANSLGVNSTPTFFINGQKYAGVQLEEDLVSIMGLQEPTVVAPTLEVTPEVTPEPTVVDEAETTPQP
ncbi:thioredoxin domain-containing protein [candidate division WWE3 bacterium]|uniref:Thioredoxin domain-containing protein n=1 Tax=candidate division WWE3 bacterium TaxID=2053526 RepID=A0A955LJC4_UNCKA|nr:thioredoxin domain-containing protein [candidate division WWE3 bacterium]